ncbi:methenyltetrahydrofolate synthase domain-containing protein-like isoform X2 [Uloborus diversus]|uniref:methenyltetrahydrofolate synthase domain-containing protein-like isoform X2 n=1 Tax=Uloborus diversus TaxID=327109 RepID=UPI002409C067|nr:methenyltetrahydrofolate synthase domain-containing protein-like isoform X2 [Uloborus diversus]
MNESDYRSKQSIRNKVWCFMEENNISEFPRPSFYRIPNFKGADEACEKVVNLEEFQKAITVKVCPDSPQKHLRFLILQKNKTLLMSKPGLKDSMFYKVVPPCNVTDDVLHLCSSLKGAKQYGVEMPNNEVKVDLIVIGSVAVTYNGSVEEINNDGCVLTFMHCSEDKYCFPSPEEKL